MTRNVSRAKIRVTGETKMSQHKVQQLDRSIKMRRATIQALKEKLQRVQDEVIAEIKAEEEYIAKLYKRINEEEVK